MCSLVLIAWSLTQSFSHLHELSVLRRVLAHFSHPELLHGVKLGGEVAQVHSGVELALEKTVEAVLGAQRAVLLLVEDCLHARPLFLDCLLS